MNLDPVTAMLVLACFFTSFVFVSTFSFFYRSGKPYLALALLAFLFHLRRVQQARAATVPPGASGGASDAPVAFGLALLCGLLDLQGVFYVMAAAGLLFLYYVLTRGLRDILMAVGAAALALQAYNRVFGPWLVHRLNGYIPGFDYQNVPLQNVSANIPKAAGQLLENVSVMLGG